MSVQETLSSSSTTAARLRRVLVRLTRTLRHHGDARLTASQMSALATLEDFGPLRISALAAHEAMDPSVATRVVATLEADDLLQREHDPLDKRASLIDLSPHGRDVLADVWRERNRGLSARLELLSPEERRAIEAALPALEKITRDAPTD